MTMIAGRNSDRAWSSEQLVARVFVLKPLNWNFNASDSLVRHGIHFIEEKTPFIG
ncbi:hypothetical protein HFN86_35885 [Rhizobium laguerreae]|uniref:hypothetical protein n=1 Tax=Rhizobium laguerreae TaxID=1076926 RepID=UPI001C912A2C|nr:hypothetical protein [Rhizobium laguerreae]MBY3425493.1 hypothetical protein [Rhizobium laguerreae]